MKPFPIHTNDEALTSNMRIRRDTLEKYGSYSVISGTLNPKALYKALSRELYELDRHGRYFDFTSEETTYTGDEETEEEKEEHMSESLPLLIAHLDDIASLLGDFYFGPHYGDGADMGFWPLETE